MTGRTERGRRRRAGTGGAGRGRRGRRSLFGSATRRQVQPITTDEVTDVENARTFTLISGLRKNRRYRQGQRLRITIRVNYIHEIRIPIIIDQRTEDETEIRVEAHVNGAWHIVGTNIAIPENAQLTYKWTKRAE